MGYCFSIVTKHETDHGAENRDVNLTVYNHSRYGTPLVSSRTYEIINPNIITLYRISKLSSNLRASSGTDNSVHSVHSVSHYASHLPARYNTSFHM